MNTSIHNIDRVYSGKQGCMCGCNGNYYTEGRMIKRVYNIVMSHPKLKIEGTFAYIDDRSGRNYVVYFKD